jgi:hypothetical protein
MTLNANMLSVLQALEKLPASLITTVLLFAPADLGQQLDVLPTSLHHLAIEATFPSIRRYRYLLLDVNSPVVRGVNTTQAILQALATAIIPLGKLELQHIPVQNNESLLQLIPAACRSAWVLSLSLGDMNFTASIEMQSDLSRLDSVLEKLRGLQSLWLAVEYGSSSGGFRGFSVPRCIVNMPCLMALSLRCGFHLMDLPEILPRMTRLRSLSLTDHVQGSQRKLQKLPPLCCLTLLTNLFLFCLEDLLEIPPLLRLTNLQHLTLEQCTVLQRLPSLHTLTAMQNLRLSKLPFIKSIPPLANLTALQILNLNDMPRLEQIPSLSTLTVLRVLGLSVLQVETIPSLANLTSLQMLSLSFNTKLQQTPSLSTLTTLKSLNLYGCSQLLELPSLDNLTALQQLNIKGCASLQNLPPMQALPAQVKLER